MAIVKRTVVDIPGTPFKLGKDVLILPPLNLLQLEQFGQPLAEFKMDTGDVKQISLIVDVITAALSRNYPEIDRVDVGTFIDLASAMPSMKALVAVSGLVDRVPDVEGKESGES